MEHRLPGIYQFTTKNYYVYFRKWDGENWYYSESNPKLAIDSITTFSDKNVVQRTEIEGVSDYRGLGY